MKSTITELNRANAATPVKSPAVLRQQLLWAKGKEWGRLIATVGGAQVLIQGVGFLSGIVVIRLLPVQEYALYTLANTMLGTMTLLADGGIATGVMSQGGKVWQDRNKLGAVLATGLELRKKFAVSSLLLAVPLLFYLLQNHGATWLMSALIVLSLIPVFFTALSGTLLDIAPRLHQDIAPLQEIQVTSSAGRLALLGLTTFVFPLAAMAILCAGAGQLWANWHLRRLVSKYADSNQVPDPAVRAEILGIVRRILPGAIFYCLSGQVTIWLVSIFGSTKAVAEVGALGRLSLALGVVGTILSIVITPRFARMPDDPKRVLLRFFQLQGLLLAVGVVAVALIAGFPTVFLAILGGSYQELTSEVVLLAIGSSIGMMGGVAYGLPASRGIIPSQKIFIPLQITVHAALIWSLPLATVKNVLVLNLVVQVLYLTIHMVYFTFGQVFAIRNLRDK